MGDEKGLWAAGSGGDDETNENTRVGGGGFVTCGGGGDGVASVTGTLGGLGPEMRLDDTGSGISTFTASTWR